MIAPLHDPEAAPRFDADLYSNGIIVAGYYIEAGARTFADFAQMMIREFGAKVRPYLRSWYMAVKYHPVAGQFDGMDDAVTVESTDLDGLEQSDNG